MTSSGFYVADAEAGRIAEPPGRSFDREATSVMPDVTKNPSFAGGMVSTAADYVRFSQRLLNVVNSMAFVCYLLEPSPS
jgi:CubicO group peptidase (beta-lactamase class C family)